MFQVLVPDAVITAGEQLAALKPEPFQQVELTPFSWRSSYSSRCTPPAPVPVPGRWRCR
jgi:hypothetical protein